jgi:hypothetical protein
VAGALSCAANRRLLDEPRPGTPRTIPDAQIESVISKAAKPMVPVCQEAFVFPDSAQEVEAHIRALLNYECVHLLDRRNIHVDHTISDLARMVQASVAPR